MTDVLLCALAGTAASIAGKVGFSHDAVSIRLAPFAPEASLLTIYLVRGVLILSVLALNAVMLTRLVASMQRFGSVTATALINALSFLGSGIAGAVLFQEPVSGTWAVGVVLILAGVGLLTYESQRQDRNKQA